MRSSPYRLYDCKYECRTADAIRPVRMKIQAGIKLLNEIEGSGDPLQDSDQFDAVLKFYRNKGDPLEFETILQDPIPYVADLLVPA